MDILPKKMLVLSKFTKAKGDILILLRYAKLNAK